MKENVLKHLVCPEPSRCLIDGRFVETDLSWVTQIGGIRSEREACGGFLAGPVGREGIHHKKDAGADSGQHVAAERGGVR